MAAKGVHLCQRAYHSGVAEVVCKLAPCETWAGCRFYSNHLVVSFAPENLSDERRGKSSEIGAATGAADDDVRLDVILAQRRLGFKSDNCLMQKHLV